MTRFNVHIYREMRLTYGGIEAVSHEEAAQLARSRATEEADSLEDYDGETFAALVDVAGDDGFEQSRMIDFEPSKRHEAYPDAASVTKLQSALKAIMRLCDAPNWNEEYRWRIERIAGNALDRSQAA
jgi:hypothetical protein